MLVKLMRKIHKNEKGITGLETAIILIAFVVVAAVFAYTVLSAGVFSSQKSQESVYAGLEETRSTMEIVGGVIAYGNTTSDSVTQLTITLMNAIDGEPIDFTPPTGDTNQNGKIDGSESGNNVVVISYVDSAQRVEDLMWTIAKFNADSDNLLEVGEKFQLTIGNTTANLQNALAASNLTLSEKFSIEIKPAVGAVIPIERTIPASVDAYMHLN